MFEHKSEPALPILQFILRMILHFAHSAWIIALWLLIGMLGYHYLSDLSWIQAFLNASMIASGMGPVDTLNSDAAKLFASFYAIFSSLVFIGLMGIMLAPIAHRVVHLLHANPDKKKEK
jgi:hypothetical protein